jgi:hypothetical protein
MCLLLILLFFGPRAGILVYYVGWPARWDVAFDSFIVPFLGFVLAPWTTLVYVVVAPDGVEGLDYVLIGLGALLDVVTLGTSGYTRTRPWQVRAARSPYPN